MVSDENTVENISEDVFVVAEEDDNTKPEGSTLSDKLKDIKLIFSDKEDSDISE